MRSIISQRAVAALYIGMAWVGQHRSQLPYIRKIHVSVGTQSGIHLHKRVPMGSKYGGLQKMTKMFLSPGEPVVPEWYQSGIFNPLGEETQRRLCQQLGLRFIKSNRCTGGGMDVPLRAPRSMHRIQGDGYCLFRAFSYAITGSEQQHLFLRRAEHENHRRVYEAPCRSYSR